MKFQYRHKRGRQRQTLDQMCDVQQISYYI